MERELAGALEDETGRERLSSAALELGSIGGARWGHGPGQSQDRAHVKHPG